MNAMLIYVDGYKPDEEAVLSRAGVPTASVRRGDSDALEELAGRASGRLAFLRAPRLSAAEYRELYRQVQGAGAEPVTPPESYETLSRIERQYPLIEALTPRAMMFDATETDREVIGRLLVSGMRFPVFVRSELESAAKYVGVDGCVIREADHAQAQGALDNLRRHVRGFETIAFKEIVSIRRTEGDSGEALEYRAIGARGRLIGFDYDAERSTLPPPSADLYAHARRAFEALAAGGAPGAAFVDVAAASDGDPIVVECKDFVNGSIAYPLRFASEFATAYGQV